MERYPAYQEFKNRTRKKNGKALAADFDGNVDPVNAALASPEDLINSAYREVEQATNDEILDFILKSEPVYSKN